MAAQARIRIEIIAPGKPQQNGRLERFHRTLKAETASPPAANVAAQQRVFDPWRREYNQERPHESLGQRPPARIYVPSSRSYPRRLVEQPFDPFGEVARVDKQGFITWHRKKVFISSALNHECIELAPNDKGHWDVYWGNIPIGSSTSIAPIAAWSFHVGGAERGTCPRCR